MSIISIYFLGFLLLSVSLYYANFKRNRWVILLVSSIIFFIFVSSWKLIFYLIFSILVSYLGSILIEKYSKKNKLKKMIYILTLVIIISQLFLLKYYNIIPNTLNIFANLFNINLNFFTINLLAPLGISYYTLSIIGYITDVYRSSYNAQKNLFKHALFCCYYPMMISGPIIRYLQIEKDLFSYKNLNWENIYSGFTRVLLGLAKKMVVADSISIIVLKIFSDYITYSGIYIIVGVFLYAIQIYMDFSGCMDIVIGASKMYGIVLPENFDAPFFSRNLSEFWRRWHISLGNWAKDYILYPLLKSVLFQNLGKISKNKFGKNIGKKIPIILATFILWLLIGLWHGSSYKYIFAAGILPWIYLTTSQLFEKVFIKINTIFKINKNCFSFHVFQSFRTIALMCLIWLFACSPTLKSSILVIHSIFVFQNLNLFLTLPKISVIAIFIIQLVILLDYLKYKGINIFNEFCKQNIIFQFLVWLIFITIILIHGNYGPGYNPSDFIYGGF